MRSSRLRILGATLALLVHGCAMSPSATDPHGSLSGGSPALPQQRLTIFAAASLTSVLDELRSAWEAATPGERLTISTDSSATLAAQIELGAPADLFLSADSINPERLARAALTAGPPVVFARNRMTIITPAGNPAGIRSPFDLGRPGVAVIAAGASVPISEYARRIVSNLALMPGAPAGFEAAYEANVRSREDNARAVVARIELGEGDAAIVYLTDAALSAELATVSIPDAANVTASYAGVVVGASPRAEMAAAFLSWLTGPTGREILVGHGFLAPD